ncbi:hypothetical protein GW17_00060072 [Ensete ventricosum]|nr:hypothetical protein GW17_00060072 [Ensete ventricosum]
MTHMLSLLADWTYGNMGTRRDCTSALPSISTVVTFDVTRVANGAHLRVSRPSVRPCFAIRKPLATYRRAPTVPETGPRRALCADARTRSVAPSLSLLRKMWGRGLSGKRGRHTPIQHHPTFGALYSSPPSSALLASPPLLHPLPLTCITPSHSVFFYVLSSVLLLLVLLLAGCSLVLVACREEFAVAYELSAEDADELQWMSSPAERLQRRVHHPPLPAVDQEPRGTGQRHRLPCQGYACVPLTAIFQSLLYEACGRIVNPIYGSLGLLWSGSWQLCQAAVEAVLKGAPITQTSSDSAAAAVPAFKAYDIRHVAKKSDAAAVPGDLHSVAARSRTRFKRSTVRPAAPPAGALAVSEPGLFRQADSHDTEESRENGSTFSAETVEGSHVSQVEPDAEPADVGLDLSLGLDPRSRNRGGVAGGDPAVVPQKERQRACPVELGLSLAA